MRKYLVIGVGLMFLLFALGLMAQTSGASGQTTNSPSSTTSSQNPNSPSGDQVGTPSGSSSSSSSGSWGAGSQSGSSSSPSSSSQSGSYGTTPPSGQSDTSGSMSGQTGSSSTGSMSGQTGMSASNGKPRTVEGCIVREESDYFLIPKSGNPVRLSSSGSNDVTPHLNHRVKIHGNEMAWNNTGSSASTDTTGSAGTTGTATAGSKNPDTNGGYQPGSQTNNPTSGVNEGGAGQGSVAGRSGSSSASSSMGTSGQLHSNASREIMVDRIDMVSESCPANWNSQFSNTGTSNPSTQEPPKY